MARAAMAAAPDNGMLRPPGPPPLGAILVQRGLLTEEQLDCGARREQADRRADGRGHRPARVRDRRDDRPGARHPARWSFEDGVRLCSRFRRSRAGGLVGPPPSAPCRRRIAVDGFGACVCGPGDAAVEPAPVPAPTPAAAPQPVAAVPAQQDAVEVARKWHGYAQQVTAQRDAALREIETAKVRLGELEAAAAARDSELAAAAARVAQLEAAGTGESDLESRDAELERQLAELAAATARVAELDAELAKARKEAESRIAELERQLAEVRATSRTTRAPRGGNHALRGDRLREERRRERPSAGARGRARGSGELPDGEGDPRTQARRASGVGGGRRRPPRRRDSAAGRARVRRVRRRARRRARPRVKRLPAPIWRRSPSRPRTSRWHRIRRISRSG